MKAVYSACLLLILAVLVNSLDTSYRHGVRVDAKHAQHRASRPSHMSRAQPKATSHHSEATSSVQKATTPQARFKAYQAAKSKSTGSAKYFTLEVTDCPPDDPDPCPPESQRPQKPPPAGYYPVKLSMEAGRAPIGRRMYDKIDTTGIPDVERMDLYNATELLPIADDAHQAANDAIREECSKPLCEVTY